MCTTSRASQEVSSRAVPAESTDRLLDRAYRVLSACSGGMPYAVRSYPATSHMTYRTDRKTVESSNGQTSDNRALTTLGGLFLAQARTSQYCRKGSWHTGSFASTSLIRLSSLFRSCPE
eukprot:gnl/TRDRNA2_/TRDRNA2_81029_c1_seq2.p2 gnl/TRDRNA2_/TRDRNA2_81029_c1~~gnl/TRDRNA2_/TRDRNA2_81029_c1_seq2.p2  ORF type:complete len:119 (+),score=0.99 gnl/TRDRNA2_/TRDRNA2_81029_c1_seq2:115-471(+)